MLKKFWAQLLQVNQGQPATELTRCNNDIITARLFIPTATWSAQSKAIRDINILANFFS